MSTTNPTAGPVCPKCGSEIIESDGLRNLFKCRKFFRHRDGFLCPSEDCKELQLQILTAELARLKSPEFGEKLERRLAAWQFDKAIYESQPLPYLAIAAEARRIAEGLMKGVE